MRILVVTPPGAVVSLEETKAHLRVRQDSEDALIQSYIDAVTQHLDGLDGWLGRALAPQVLEVQLAARDDVIALPLPPLISLVSVKYLDRDGVEQTADVNDFYLYGSEGNILKPVAAHSPWAGGSSREDAVRIRYNAGYTADPEADPLVAAVPAVIRSCILAMVTDLYDNRGTVGFANAATPIQMSPTVEGRLTPFRLWA